MARAAEAALAKDAAAIADWLKAGGNLLAIGLDQQDVDFLPSEIGIRKREHIATFFEPPAADSLFSGVGPADVHNRDPRQLPLVDSGATIVGDGVLAVADGLNIVFCQLAPWQFDGAKQWNLKKTYRRSVVPGDAIARQPRSRHVDADSRSFP